MDGILRVPNKSAKDRKRKRLALNKKLGKEGRTSKQYKKWLEKQGNKPKGIFGGSR